jgi:hypothetical protein
MNEHEKESVVKAQITYFKWVISPPNIDHKLFFFSKERKKLSCETLIVYFVNVRHPFLTFPVLFLSFC